MNVKPYSILLVDDHPIVTNALQGLIQTLDQTQCAAANDLDTLENLLARQAFDLCIVDLEFPGSNGFELIPKLYKRMPHCRFLLYTMHEEPWIAAKLLAPDIHPLLSGALSKHAKIDELIIAIGKIREGKNYFGKAFDILNEKKSGINRKRYGALSEREKEVFAYLAQGLSTTEIAKLMYLSINTIQTYRKRLLEKLEAKNVAELISKGKGLF